MKTSEILNRLRGLKRWAYDRGFPWLNDNGDWVRWESVQNLIKILEEEEVK